MTGLSPTQRSLKHLRDAGWTAAVVERRLPFNNVTQDLFGFIDIVAIKGGTTMGVQTTTGSHAANRAHKIEASPLLPAVREAGWVVVVHGWRKLANGRWEVREVTL